MSKLFRGVCMLIGTVAVIVGPLYIAHCIVEWICGIFTV